MDVIPFVQDYGALVYALTFVWTFLEGETFVLFAGLAAQRDLLDARFVIAAAWAGTFVGDNAWFLLGRRYGARLMDQRPHWRASVDRALAALERWDAGFILSFRFIYGVRNVASFALGMSELKWRRFVVLNFLAAGLWACSFVGFGYVFGASLAPILGTVGTGFGLAMLGLFLCVSGAILVLRRASARRRAQVIPANNNQQSEAEARLLRHTASGTLRTNAP